MKPRIIVCGLGRTGYKIFSLLKQQGASVVGISTKPLDLPAEPLRERESGSDIVVGELQSAETLMNAGIRQAHTLVIAGATDAVNLEILVQARILNPQIRIINRLFNASLGDRLDRTLPAHVSMSVSDLAAPVFSFAAFGNRAIGQLRLFNQTWPMHEECIDEHHPWKDRPLADLWDDRNRMLIYYLPAETSVDLVSAVIHGHTLKVGDRLIVATKPSIRTTRKSIVDRLKKFLTSVQRFYEHSQSSIWVTFVLFLTIFGTTVTYTWVTSETTFIDALYFSVGMITGAGGNEKVAEYSPDIIKVFTAAMMLVGAGVVGIYYALLNDLVLGTRFRQLWNSAPIPQKNHYIICGLGGIGIKIASQLQASGYEVVAIDRDPNTRFLHTARALKIPVIQGDARLSSTLESARLCHADALLAVTSNDTANLEIALTAKGLAPKLPVVARNQDGHFSRMFQQVFEFDAVLSPTELAAPAFAAAALGGRIFGNGMTADTLWVALATLITPAHPFCTQRVKDAAMKADFVPLYIETNCSAIHGWDLLEICLSAGDVLYLTMPANKLELLWRTTPSLLLASSSS
jgi:Trk K+ transport system NAD-binding subunit